VFLPPTLLVLVLRLMLVIVLVAAIAIMIVARRLVLVGVVAFLLELAVRILAGRLAPDAGGGMVQLRSHGVLAVTATGPARLSRGTG
jgi:hypothetical protein